MEPPWWARAGANCHMDESITPVLCERVTRYLAREAPRLPYAPRARGAKRQRTERVPVHRGQRKLLASEVAFLLHLRVHLGYKRMTVVYAGAASGDHIPLLAALFPSVSFVCVDPRRFAIRESDRIRIVRGYMTDEMARELRDELRGVPVALVSDIRCASEKKPTEEDVAGDMEHQLSWHGVLCPDAALFKFRLPWGSGGETRYLAGSIQLPVLGPSSTTEARLVVTREHGPHGERAVYTDLAYEEQMSHFNRVVRGTYVYPHPVDGGHIDLPNLCHCHDCVAELEVLRLLLDDEGSREAACRVAGCPVSTHNDLVLVLLRAEITAMQPDKGTDRPRAKRIIAI
jgi:hypothetical protein